MTEQEMMANWMRNATPGEPHANLAKWCGEYEVHMIERGQPMKGDVKIEMMLDGRVQVQHFTMDFQGMPFTGFGMMGYDNFTQRYWFTWNDNMSTGIYSMWGEARDGGKSIVFEGLMDSPGKNIRQLPVRHTWHVVNEHELRYEVLEYPGTPQEAKTMDMTYKRK
ncbi:MAG: DUF1579 family protein [bacterium]|nr:DUF1579 family protein [bacterium]